MTTLSALLKELFKTKRNTTKSIPHSTKKGPEEESSINDKIESNPTYANQENLNNQSKTNGNETKTDENPGDPRLDHPSARQTARPSEEGVTPESSVGEIDAQPEQPTPKIEKSGEENPEIEARLKAAYEKGRIDGRNDKIEELYFPKTDDGIPVFHGSPSGMENPADFFSIAREA